MVNELDDLCLVYPWSLCLKLLGILIAEDCHNSQITLENDVLPFMLESSIDSISATHAAHSVVLTYGFRDPILGDLSTFPFMTAFKHVHSMLCVNTVSYHLGDLRRF